MARKDELRELLRKNPEIFADEFKITRKVPTIKKTFEVPADLLDQFFVEARKRGLKIKVAITEAIQLWLDSGRK